MTSALPIRIQRKRTKGWKMPANTVYVGRPSIWANPFVVGRHGDAANCVRLFRLCVCGQPMMPGELTTDQLRAANDMWPDHFSMPCASTASIFLRGKNLACWCDLSSPCHADVLLELANKDQP